MNTEKVAYLGHGLYVESVDGVEMKLYSGLDNRVFLFADSLEKLIEFATARGIVSSISSKIHEAVENNEDFGDIPLDEGKPCPKCETLVFFGTKLHRNCHNCGWEMEDLNDINPLAKRWKT
jgi:hypothetical protein